MRYGALVRAIPIWQLMLSAESRSYPWHRQNLAEPHAHDAILRRFRWAGQSVDHRAGALCGGALQQTGIGQMLSDAISGHQHFVAAERPFLVTVFVGGAQGSATVP